MIPADQLIKDLSSEPLSVRLRRAILATQYAESEAAPNYRVSMRLFHFLDEDGTCVACMGGAAAIAFFKKWDHRIHSREDLLSDYFKDPLYSQLKFALSQYEESLDCLRLGNVTGAYKLTSNMTGDQQLLNRLNAHSLNRYVYGYNSVLTNTNHLFYADMEKLVTDLQAVNL